MRIAIFWGGEHTLPGRCDDLTWYSFYNSGWRYGFENLGHQVDYFAWNDESDHPGYDLYVYAPGFLTNTTFRRKLHHPNVFFTEEAALAVSWGIAHTYYYDHVCSLDFVNVTAMVACGAKNVHWVPGAVDPTIFHIMNVGEPSLGREWDAAFLGTYDQSVVIDHGMTRLDYLRAMERTIPRILVGTGYYAHNANNIWNVAKVGIDVPIVEFCSFRLFQIIAAGAFAVTRKSRIPTGIDLLLQPEHYTTYEDVEDLAKNVMPRLMADPELASKQASAREYVLKNHTFVNRAHQLLKIVGLV